MKTKFKFLIPFFLLIACTNEQKTNTAEQTPGELSTFTTPVQIDLTELHDTLKPVVVFLDDVKKPISKTVSSPFITKLPISTSLIDSVTKVYPEAQAHGLFTTYTSDDGLALDAISWGHKSSICDSYGNIWFGTAGGVSKYDGTEFITFTSEQGLPNNEVFCMTEDRKGNFWFGTAGGVSKYDGTAFINYTAENGLAANQVFSIAEDKIGNLWFGTAAGVTKYDGTTFTTYTTELGVANLEVCSIAEDKAGNLWFGTYGGGASKYDGTDFTTYTVEQGLSNNTVCSIAQDKTGNLWFGTAGGVTKYDGTTFTNYSTENGLAYNTVLSITEDKNGNLWFGTNRGGVSKYDGTAFITYSTEQGLANNNVYSITEDKTGNLWFGTNGGVSKYEGSAFITYDMEQGLGNSYVRSIADDKIGNIWFGTDGGGVSKYDGKTLTTYTSEHGLANNNVYCITVDEKGNLWFGTSIGLSKFDGVTFTNYDTRHGLANNYIRSIVEDKTGNLWFGTNGGGVSMFDGEAFTTYTTSQGLANNYIRGIIEDKNGNLWFGTDNGATKFDGTSFTTYTKEQGLANNHIRTIAEDNTGNLWFGTYGGGISVMPNNRTNINDTDQDGNPITKLFFNLNTKNGLPDNAVASIRVTESGKVFIGCNFGIWVLSSDESLKITKNASLDNSEPLGELGKIYNQFNGYPIKGVNTAQDNGAMQIDRNGILWVGHGANGVMRVDLNAVTESSSPPNVLITSLSLKDETVCWYNLMNQEPDSITLAQQEIAAYHRILTQPERDTLQARFSGVTFDSISKWYSLPENLVLPYNHNALTFNFKAIETGRNFMVNYQFMLKGMDETWSAITKKRDATYNNLPEGDYTFLLKAQSPWGVWSEPIEYRFTILPPWYRTWWAYAIYALLFMGIVWLLVRVQTKRLKQRQKELEVEVKLATQEIRKQKEQVEETHKEITDSINYAERIQRSFLATKELLDENLNEYFVFFQPKDVVSGDFYWAGLLSSGNFALVNADSTGHGVPGAIMSILNISSIEEAVKEGSTAPQEIFNKARTFIVERLKKDGSEEGGKDGMDASLISFNREKTSMSYVAAQNPIWIIRNGKLSEIKPEKMPVGKHDKDHIPFKGGEFEIQKGDQIYTLTDGFQDQFGGPKGKKFMIKNMREFVLSISDLSMDEQHQKFKEAFINWKGNTEQLDDVCVIGIKV